MDEARALADGWTQAEIDAEKARRAGKPAPSPSSSVMSQVGDAAKWVAQQPVDLVGGIKRSLADTGRGIRQAAAYVAPGLVDPEAARQAQVAVEEADKANPTSLAHDAGKIVGDVAPWMIGAGMLPKVIGAAPKVAKSVSMIPSAIRTLAGGAAGGAAQGVVSPEAGEYDMGEKAGTGAAWGAAMGPVGWLAGKAYAPFRNAGAGATARENAALLNAEGLPAQIPATQTDAPMVQAMTNALEQIPGAGHWVRKARDKNAQWLTSKVTEPTGKAVEELTPSARKEMFDRLNEEGNAFRTSKPIKMTKPSEAAADAVRNVEQYAMDTAQQSGVKPLVIASQRLADLAGNPATAQRAASGMPVPQYRGIPEIRTSDQVMNLRNAAGELAHAETDPILKNQYRAYRNALADALQTAHPDKDVKGWLGRWGAMEDVQRAAGKGGKELVGGKLTPDRLAQNLDDSFRPGSKMDDLISAASENMPTPPKGWNRAMIQSLMLGGAPMALGAGADYIKGDVGPGTALGSAVSASLIGGLSRKAPSQAKIDAFRRMIMAGGIGADPFN